MPKPVSLDPPGRIAILGAGPIGLEAALYARFLGFEVDVYERREVAENVRRWGHVRLFSPFGMNRSPLGLQALAAQDENYTPPGNDELLTGREWAERYLLPLAGSDLVADSLHTQTEVIAVGREGLLKGDAIGQDARGDSSFRLLLNHQGGERTTTADVVIDTTGNYGNANWLGGATPAVGELACRDLIEYGVPDVLGRDRGKYQGRHTLVIGSGYSAATTVVAITDLACGGTDSVVTWFTRSSDDSAYNEPINRIENDRLASRDQLAACANELASSAESHSVAHYNNQTIVSLRHEAKTNQFHVETIGSDANPKEWLVDNIVANVGYRPDLSILSELQVHTCYATEGPMKLAAALLGETSADCLDQTSRGPAVLVNPEPHLYVLGSKSYGRNSNFLISVGLEQIRDVFKLIVGRDTLDLYGTMEGAAS